MHEIGGAEKRIRYNPDPDYTRPQFDIPRDVQERMYSRLIFLYGEKEAQKWMPQLERTVKVHHAYKPREMIDQEEDYDPRGLFTEQDLILITYGDIIHSEGGDSPLVTLHQFVEKFNRGSINTLHILPFFPYSSDRGFAVTDFRRVDPKLGTWGDILNIGSRYKLMFDGVLNHCSAGSQMFRGFINGNPELQDFFIAYDSPDDLTPDQRGKIFRPRTSDILSRFDTYNGPKWVWTTFSEDQIDLNFRNPAVLLQIIESLLFYIRNGANLIRLDAVTYIWAEPGTECVHLPQTHEIVKLLRDVIDTVAPDVAVITETNVPHKDNVSYFGNGYDEAHMVYNFALPPLVLYTFYRGDATDITKWARALKVDSDAATFFNFLDSHDGIGLMGVKEILSRDEIDFIIERAKSQGALISHKMTEERKEEPYEINSTWWSAINGDGNREEIEFQVRRYVATRSIALVIPGVPGIYVHGALGTPNDHELARKTGVNRDVNRGSIDSKDFEVKSNAPNSKRRLLRDYSSRIFLNRSRQRAFHPQGDQRVIALSPDLFAVLRTSPEGDEHIFCLTNVTGRESHIEVSLSDLKVAEEEWFDLINEREWVAEENRLSIRLQPYDILWLKPKSEIMAEQETAG